jgi:hypothetical protein
MDHVRYSAHAVIKHHSQLPYRYLNSINDLSGWIEAAPGYTLTKLVCKKNWMTHCADKPFQASVDFQQLVQSHIGDA